MRGLAVACLALVACDDAVAIEIRIPKEVTADRVDLFIGKKRCVLDRDFDGDGDPDPCPGIGPPGAMAKLRGDVFEVDDIAQFFVEVPAGASSVEFRLEGETELPVVLAVATSATSRSPGAAILRDIDLGSGARRYVAVLEPAMPQLTIEDRPSQNGFQTWPDSRDPFTCAGVQFHGERVFVVPADDFDCDQVAAPECDRFVNNAFGPRDITADEVTCAVVRPPAGFIEPHCMLGGPPCDEVGGSGSGDCFNRRDICTSSIVCDCTTANIPDLQCITQKLQTNPPLADRIFCSVALEDDPNSAELIPCNQSTTDRAVLPTAADQCDARLGKLELGGQLDNSVTIVDGSLEFKMSTSMDGCSFGLATQGVLAAPQPGAEVETFRGVALIDIGVRSALVPLEVHFTTDACRPDACIASADADIPDNVFECLQ